MVKKQISLQDTPYISSIMIDNGKSYVIELKGEVTSKNTPFLCTLMQRLRNTKQPRLRVFAINKELK